MLKTTCIPILNVVKLLISLAHRLIEKNCRTNRNIERVHCAVHWYSDMGIGCVAPSIGESGVLSPHYNNGGMAHVGVVIEFGIL